MVGLLFKGMKFVYTLKQKLWLNQTMKRSLLLKISCSTITGQSYCLDLHCLSLMMLSRKEMENVCTTFTNLLSKANGKTKYSYVILLYLVKLAGLMSQKDAHNLKWNRFYNKHGIKGGNIPLDLRMEHMNKIVKTMWKALGSNINETSA